MESLLEAGAQTQPSPDMLAADQLAVMANIATETGTSVIGAAEAITSEAAASETTEQGLATVACEQTTVVDLSAAEQQSDQAAPLGGRLGSLVVGFARNRGRLARAKMKKAMAAGSSGS